MNYGVNGGRCVLASRQHVYTWTEMQINLTINLTNRQREREKERERGHPHMCTFTHKSTEIIQCIPTSHPEDLYIGCLALKLYDVTFIIIIIIIVSSLSGVGSLSVTLMRSYIFVFSGILMTLYIIGGSTGVQWFALLPFFSVSL